MAGRWTLVLGCVWGVSACAPPQEIDPARMGADRGATLFAENCAVCHGADAKGAGSASLGLGGPPPALHHLSRDNGGSFPRDHVMTIIDGYTRRSHASDAMPEFGAGDLGPLIQVEHDGVSTPVPADLLALSAYLESIQE